MFRRNPKMKELSVPSRVNPPPRPLMIWDGECHFCRRWIERWREITAGEVEYAPYQEIADRFPEIPREQFQRSVVYIDKTGQVFAQKNGCGGATNTFLASLRFLNWVTTSSHDIAGSPRQ